MLEITIIAIVFMVAIELNCGDLFNAKHNTQTIDEPVQSTSSVLHSSTSTYNLDSCESLPILRCRKCKSEKAEKADATNVKGLQ